MRRGTARELAGYLQQRGRTKEAEKQIETLECLREEGETAGRTVYDEPTFLRPRIEWLIEAYQREPWNKGLTVP